MANLKGWKYDNQRDTKPVILAADVSEGQLLKITDGATSPVTVNVCGAGEVPYGVAPRTVDISEEGTRHKVVFRGLAPILAAAAITDATLPVTTAASGKVTPVTANNDVIAGKPEGEQAINEIALIDLQLMGTYYGA